MVEIYELPSRVDIINGLCVPDVPILEVIPREKLLIRPAYYAAFILEAPVEIFEIGSTITEVFFDKLHGREPETKA